MHGSIQDRLEYLLSEGAAASVGEETAKHLTNCPECTAEVQEMRSQVALLKSLRAPEAMEPAAGFYARVMQRIEERSKDSIWSAFVYSQFATRLVYASLTLVVALGSFMVAQESRDGHLHGYRAIAQQFHYDAPVVGNQDQQRDAVLENFAVH